VKRDPKKLLTGSAEREGNDIQKEGSKGQEEGREQGKKVDSPCKHTYGMKYNIGRGWTKLVKCA